MNGCLEIEVLDELAAGGKLPDEVRAHLEVCTTCRGEFERARRNTGFLRSIHKALRTTDFPITPATAVAGRQIGRFEIRGVLGQGGMATVYHAVQEYPHREVALKVMKYDLPAGPARRRFEYEVETLARLQHPGIAQLYEAGAVDIGFGPQPFFAMELVQGRRLTEYADAHRLDIRERLELMAKIGEAVHHAHQKGIIHRDLKPSNILVVEEGTEARTLDPSVRQGQVHEGTKEMGDANRSPSVASSRADPGAPGEVPTRRDGFVASPKILDFGVARATDSDVRATTLQTGMGQLIGTIPYMSPEQVTGDPKELDVRSDVYALGVVCYELLSGRLPYEVREASVPDAARIIREEDPALLSSVNKSFRGDIETIVGKALEKDKSRRYASVAAFVADIRRYLNDEPISARPPSTIYQLSKFARRNKALVGGGAAVFLALLAGLVGTSYGLRAAHARRAEAETVVDLLENMLGSANPHQVKGADFTVRQLLDEFAENLGDQVKRQPEVGAAIHATVGNTYRRLGLPASAEPHLRAALELRRKTRPEEHSDVAQSLFDYALYLHDNSEYSASEEMLRQSLDIRRRLLGREHADVASSLNWLSDVQRHRENFESAVPLAREALTMRRKLLGSEHADVAESLNNLGRMLNAKGDHEEAERCLREALRTWRKVYAGDHPEIASGLYELAMVLDKKGDRVGAEPVLREALAMGRKVYGERHHKVSIMLKDLGILLGNLGNYSEGVSLVREGVSIAREVHKDRHLCTANFVNYFGIILRDSGQFEESEAASREALDLFSSLQGDEHRDSVEVRSNLASVLVLRGSSQEAEPLARTVLSQCDKLHGDHRSIRADAMRILGQALVGKGALVEAEALLSDSVRTFRTLPQVEGWRVARAENAWGQCLKALGKFDEAEPLLTESFRVLQQARGPVFVDTKLALRDLCGLYEAWNRPEDAARFCTTPATVEGHAPTIDTEE